MRLVIFWLVCFLYASVFAAQQPLFKNYQKFTTADGLPQVYVSSFAQDQYGFIWVGTHNGLARYDGSQFLHFNTDSSSSQLSTLRVQDLWFDGKQRLYIMHFNDKVDVLNTHTLSVQKDVPKLATAFFGQFKLTLGREVTLHKYYNRDVKSNHWFFKSDSQYFFFNPDDESMRRLFDAKLGQERLTLGFDVDEFGRLWMVNTDGLEVSDKEWSSFSFIPFSKEILKDSIFTGYNYWAIARLSNQRIFFSRGDQAYLFYEHKNNFKKLDLSMFSAFGPAEIVFSTFDNEGRLIFEYQGNFIRIESDDSMTLLWQFPDRDKLGVTRFMVDASSNLWVAINSGGLYRVDLKSMPIQSRRYQKNFLFDLLTNEFELNQQQLPASWNMVNWANDLRYVKFDSDDYLFAQDGSYLGRERRIFRLKGGEILQLPLANNHLEYIRGLGGSQDNFWAIDTYGSMFHWTDLNQFPDSIPWDLYEKNTALRPLSLTVDSAYQWILTANNGIFKTTGGKTLKQYELVEKDINLIDMIQDPANQDFLWIGTYGKGLIKWSKSQESILKIYTSEDGLSNEIVTGIIADNFGALWLSTFNGLNRLDTLSDHIDQYILSDGLLETEFNRYHHFVLPDDQLVFGGMDGYIVFDPADYTADQFEPRVLFTSITYSNPSDLSLTRGSFESVNDLERLELAHDDYALEIGLATNQFNNSDKNKFRYKLSGFLEQWIEVGREKQIKFDKLPAGQYELIVNVSNTRGVWSPKSKSIQLIVNPPFWLSVWAWLVYIVIFGVLVWYYWRSYKQRIIFEQEKAYSLKEAERIKELDKIKSRFFSNIIHEFRTPLTLIMSPLDKLINSKEISGKLLEVLKTNFTHAQKLLGLVNQLQDIARLEAGQMQINQTIGSFEPFINKCVKSFEHHANERAIHLNYQVMGLDGYYYFDKLHWETILTNLLSNAIKFTPSGGTVSVELRKVNADQVSMKVKDTGYGIPIELQSKLYDRFYQVDDSSTRTHEGAGIGLSIVKELVELLGGQIDLQSQVKVGSTFTVLLPLLRHGSQEATEWEEEIIEASPVIETEDLNPWILVAEDNTELRKFIVESMAEHHQVLEAENGTTAWEVIKEKLPDIVISDVMMPEMDGIQLSQLIKNDERTAHIALILLTAKTGHEAKIEGLQAGADDYMTKPFDYQELILRVQNQLSRLLHLRRMMGQELSYVQNKSESQPTLDPFIEKLYAFLDKQIRDTKMNVDDLADTMAMSRSTLNRKLKSILGMSANELIRKYRLKKAAQLLKQGCSITEVIVAVGFDSQSYFSTMFKEYSGITPSEYQRSTERESIQP